MKNIHFLLYYSLKFYNNDYFIQNTESIAILKRSPLPLASSEICFIHFVMKRSLTLKISAWLVYSLRSNPEVTVVRALCPLFREMIFLPPKNTKFKGPGAQRSARCQRYPCQRVYETWHSQQDLLTYLLIIKLLS